MDTLAPFRSRSEALKLYNALSRQGIACAAVNTPSYLKIGCGLSVVFNSSYKVQASILISRLNLKTFVGYFSK